MVGSGDCALRDAGPSDPRSGACRPRLRACLAEETTEFFVALEDTAPSVPSKERMRRDKMQTLTTIIQWSAIAIATFVGIGVFTAGGVPFVA